MLEKYLEVKKTIAKINRVCGPNVMALMLFTSMDIVCIPQILTEDTICSAVYYSSSIINLSAFLIAADWHKSVV